MSQLIEWVLHLDRHIDQFVAYCGPWTYCALFAIVFCETGVVVLPLLPGDSLLFVVGALAGREQGPLNVNVLWGTLVLAAILGDTVNYHVGKFLGPKVLCSETSRWLNKKHLLQTQKFFEKHGQLTIVLARFVPIVRTFAPFVAGVGAMNYLQFLAYNVVGGFAWVTLFVWGGYFFGGLEIVKTNLHLVLLAIIVISVAPMLWAWWRNRAEPAAAAAVETTAR